MQWLKKLLIQRLLIIISTSTVGGQKTRQRVNVEHKHGEDFHYAGR